MKYIVDDKGEKTSIIVPFDQWEKMKSNYKKLQKKIEVLTSIKEGIKEIKEAQKQGKNLPTLSEFLDECSN